jgi:hypothetical protein
MNEFSGERTTEIGPERLNRGVSVGNGEQFHPLGRQRQDVSHR